MISAASRHLMRLASHPPLIVTAALAIVAACQSDAPADADGLAQGAGGQPGGDPASGPRTGGGSARGGEPAATPVTQKPTLDCGTISPGIGLACTDGDPADVVEEAFDDERRALVPQPDVVSAKLSYPCKLPRTNGDSGDELRASVLARCLSSAGAWPRWQHEVEVEGEVERMCGGGDRGSGASAHPLWQGALVLPAKVRYRVDVESLSLVAYALRGCVVKIAGDEADPILVGESHLATRFIEGPARIDIELDCRRNRLNEAFVASTCIGYVEGHVASPPEQRARIALSIRSATCPEGCASP